MPTILRGEIPIRVRDGADPSKILQYIAPLFQEQGVLVSELTERQLKFEVDSKSAHSAGKDIEFIHSGTVVAIPRPDNFRLGYYVSVSMPPWPALIVCVALLSAVLIAFWPPEGIGCTISLPLPAVSLAALGHRAARQKQVRKLITDVVDTIPGIDC